MIYCVEDDKNILQMMLYTLKSAGFDAKGFENSTGFWYAMENKLPDLVMLDIMLPVEDGLQILEKLRGNPKTKNLYIIMATAKGSEYDTVVGLDKGADYYLTKPFGMMEMIALIKAVMRRGKEIVYQNKVVVGDLVLDTSKHEITVKGTVLNLTYKEFEILNYFLQNTCKVITREEILLNIWGDNFFGEIRTVDVHIAALRTKMGDCGDYIETVRGVGYIMNKR